MTEQSLGHDATFGLSSKGRGPRSLYAKVLGKFLWPLLRHQVDVNHAVLHELHALRSELAELRAVAELELSPTGPLATSVSHQVARSEFLEDGLHNVERALHILEEQYVAVMAQRDDHVNNVQRLFELRTQQLETQIDLGQRQLLGRFYDGFGALQRDLSEVAQARRVEESTMATIMARLAELDHFLTEVKRAYPDTVKPERLVRLASGFDAIQAAHAQRFRGSREVVKSRVSVYLDQLRGVADLGPVLDIGCGSGELLEILAESGIRAYGIELSDVLASADRDRGLDVRVDDALHHLAELPESTLGAVVALHVVEHLDTDTLLEMLDLALRALRPGGVLILETPNPGNVTVGANGFYLDPTHQHPLPSSLLEFFVSIRGFTEVSILPLSRSTNPLVRGLEGADDSLRVLAQRIGEELLGPEDYAVVARRPS